MAPVSFASVGKVYPDGTTAVRDLDLEIADGEFIVFVGPSGCGKTSALRMVAGLEKISSGTIAIGERTVNEVDPADRDVAMVFQNYALYPHMSVYDNIAFGLRMQRVRKPQIDDRVRRIAGLLGLTDHLQRRPRQLSGGQRQRVAMGRAMVRSPAVFLMDEPLSNLDAKLRVQMRAEVSRIQHELGATTIYVTHDQVEAMTMGDRVAVLRKGELQQIDDPQVLYDSPANLFVAGFIGNPSMNLLEGGLSRNGDGLEVELAGERFPLSAEVAARRPALPRYAGRTVGVGLRPEHLGERADERGELALRGTATVTEALGSERLVHFDLEARPVVTDAVLELAGDLDATAADELQSGAREHRTAVIARFDGHSRVRAGDAIEARFSPDALYFFDLDSGQAIYG